MTIKNPADLLARFKDEYTELRETGTLPGYATEDMSPEDYKSYGLEANDFLRALNEVELKLRRQATRSEEEKALLLFIDAHRKKVSNLYDWHHISPSLDDSDRQQGFASPQKMRTPEKRKAAFEPLLNKALELEGAGAGAAFGFDHEELKAAFVQQLAHLNKPSAPIRQVVCDDLWEAIEEKEAQIRAGLEGTTKMPEEEKRRLLALKAYVKENIGPPSKKLGIIGRMMAKREKKKTAKAMQNMRPFVPEQEIDFSAEEHESNDFQTAICYLQKFSSLQGFKQGLPQDIKENFRKIEIDQLPQDMQERIDQIKGIEDSEDNLLNAIYMQFVFDQRNTTQRDPSPAELGAIARKLAANPEAGLEDVMAISFPAQDPASSSRRSMVHQGMPPSKDETAHSAKQEQGPEVSNKTDRPRT